MAIWEFAELTSSHGHTEFIPCLVIPFKIPTEGNPEASWMVSYTLGEWENPPIKQEDEVEI